MNNSSSPLVSVILSTYNFERFIRESVDSVLKQTLTDFELIVVDDASSDRTVEIVKCIDDPRIRLVEADLHRGSDAGTRNRGLSYARGEFVSLLDGDDLYEPDALENLSAYLLENPEKIVVYGFFRKIDGQGRLIPNQYEHLSPGDADNRLHVRPEFSNTLESFLLGRNIPVQFQGLMIRRSFLETLGGIPEALPQMSDKLFFSNMLLSYPGQVGFIEAYVFKYRMHAHNITRGDAAFANHIYSIFQSFSLIYENPAFPSNLKQNVSYYTAIMLSQVYATHKLSIGCNQHAREILIEGLRCPYLKKKDWLRYCLPYYLATWLPGSVFSVWKNMWSMQVKPIMKRCFWQPCEQSAF